MVKRSMISQLASVSEGALGKTFQAGMQVKDRVERLVHAITELDDRVAALEKRVGALEKPKRRTPAKRTTASTAKKTTASTAKKTTASTARKTTAAAAKPRASASKSA